MGKYVFDFEEGDWKNKKLLGGKGASLAQMTQYGLPVPPGFIISTTACRDFYKCGEDEISKIILKLEKQPPPEVRDNLIKELWRIIDSLSLPEGLMEEVKNHLHKLEIKKGQKFGDPENPLLVSVRSGAPVSMPGMMDTILNLGLNDVTVEGLASKTNNWRFAYDAYRRLLQLFGKIVLNIDGKLFENELDDIKRKYNVSSDVDIPVDGLKELVVKYKEILERYGGGFPQDPWLQLEMAIKAVFRSWMNPRAIFYRIANKITGDIANCTAVNVQSMVFGNMGFDSGTGVVFSRNVANGENELYGEFLPNAQGEDVVAGIRTPMPISELKDRHPDLYKTLYDKVKLLEKLNKEVQDVEFTVENGKLYFLQTRNAKMTPLAKVKTCVEMAREGIISKEEAIIKIKPEHVLQLLYPRIDKSSDAKPIAKGLNASPGAVSGHVVFNPDDAVEWAREGKDVILVRVETKPDDVHGFYAAKGILTSRGGMTCFSGDTIVLTNKGFLTMKEVSELFSLGEELQVLSFDYKNMKTVWKKVIAVGKRWDHAIRVSVPLGSSHNENNLDLTPSHKIYTFEEGILVKKEIKDILKEGKMVCSIDKVRKLQINKEHQIIPISFITSKNEKIKLLDHVSDENNVSFSFEDSKSGVGEILMKRKLISNSSSYLSRFNGDFNSLDIDIDILLNIDEKQLLSYTQNIIFKYAIFDGSCLHFFVKSKEILENLVILYLRLGIVPEVIDKDDGGWTLSIKRQDKLLKFNIEVDPNNVPDDIEYKLADGFTIKKLLESDLRMVQIEKVRDIGYIDVYNIEVDSLDEMDKNYIVFTKCYTPILASNSHAAVVARGIGKPAVVGAETIKIDYEANQFVVNNILVKQGDWITIDGNTGEVFLDKVPTIEPEVIPELRELLDWADEFRRLGVKANADLPEDAKIARDYGAEGIGLLRIERMFRKPERLELLRRVILSETTKEREKAMYELSELVKNDFKEILEVMDGLPVTIRLIDPPLHEFLPKPEEVLREIYELEKNNESREVIDSIWKYYKRIVALSEANPMMGHRGVRVGVTYPEIYKGLTKAMLEATAELILEGKNPILQIMVPQVAMVDELRFVKEHAINPIAKMIEEKYGIKIPFMVGTMIETVRSALTADEIAKEADFFSFGTNDLTQATYTFSRDDVENKFLPQYLDLGILKNNPFETLDKTGVGELVKLAVERGRNANPDLEIGICGEHGGDPDSIHFFHKAGLDYVSASPFRILIARLASAHAALLDKK